MSSVAPSEPIPAYEAHKPAFLRRVRIRGYKSLAFCDVALEPLTILVGRNASGKSNFLDALGFLRDLLETNLHEALRRHGGWSSIVSRAGDQTGVAFELDLGTEDVSGRYTVEITGTGNAPPTIGKEVLDVDYGEQLDAGFEVENGIVSTWQPPLSGTVPHSTELLDRMQLRPGQLLLAGIGTPPILDLADGLRWMGVYNFHPEMMRLPQKPNPGYLLERDGRNLASVLRTTQEVERDSLERIGRYLNAITAPAKFLEVVPIGEYEALRFSVTREEGKAPLEFDANSMSDGTLRVLAALTAAFQFVQPRGYPSLVAIEEPETSLHPAAMRALVDALDSATLRTQILLTTHSAEMLDNPTIRPENVRVVQMIDGQTVIAPVDAASIEIVRRNLNTLGGLERDGLLELDLADVQRQRQLELASEEPGA
jgi:predicted ATPase